MKHLWLVLLAFFGMQAHADLANDLLQASDRGRGGITQGLTWNIKLDTKEDGETSSREFKVKARGNDALVEALNSAELH